MQIKADEEGKKVIEQLCDIALKHGGIQNLNQVALILNSTKLIENAEKKEENKTSN